MGNRTGSSPVLRTIIISRYFSLIGEYRLLYYVDLKIVFIMFGRQDVLCYSCFAVSLFYKGCFIQYFVYRLCDRVLYNIICSVISHKYEQTVNLSRNFACIKAYIFDKRPTIGYNITNIGLGFGQGSPPMPILSYKKFVGNKLKTLFVRLEVIMKKLRKIIYIALLVLTVSVLSLFAAACGDKRESAPSEYTIYFMLDATNEYDSYTGVKGSDIVRTKDDPVKANYEFDGWSLSPNGEVVELPQKMPGNSVKYYAVFSRRYTITLNVGSGTLDTANKLSVKANQKLYDIVSDIIPAAPGESEFDAWYYGNKKIDAQSTVSMPSSSITLDARYSIGYTVNVYKETGFKTDTYTEFTADKVTKTGFVGTAPKETEFPSFAEYDLNVEKSGNPNQFVLAADGSNVYNAYYALKGCNLTFNGNAPEGETLNGNAMNTEWGYGTQNDLPECGYSISGYRFSYWSTSKDGGERLYPEDKYSITQATTLYAVWTKAYTDFNGRSYDNIFIDTDKNGDHVAYLQRINLSEQKGEYDPSTKVFSFKDGNRVILSGKIDEENGTYLCISESVYYLHNIGTDLGLNGNVDKSVTLLLDTKGDAVYNDGSAEIVGIFEQDAATQSMKFISDSKTFYFRISTHTNKDTYEVNDVFDIRGAEYGDWNNLTSDETVDTAFKMTLDGFGNAVMTATGLKSDFKDTVTVTTNGFYRFTENSTADNVELYVAFVRNSTVDAFKCRLLKGTYSSGETQYTNVYIENVMATTVYAHPGAGELDINTADKIVLDGYGIFDGSAVMTVNGTSTNNKYILETNAYKYLSRLNVYSLTVIPQSGDSAVYELGNVKVGETTYLTYTLRQNVARDYEITKLESVYDHHDADTDAYYKLRIHNDGIAEFMFNMPTESSVYGVTNFKYLSGVVGKYSRIGNTDEYLFTASISAETAMLLYYQYNAIYKMPLNISGFGNFKFKFVQPETADGSVSLEATAISDNYGTSEGLNPGGLKFTYNGIEYTTDGYGKANGSDGSSYDYMVSDEMGLPCLMIEWKEPGKDADGKDTTVTKTEAFFNIGSKESPDYLRRTETYGKYNTQYASYFPGHVFYMLMLEDNYAVLACISTSNGAVSIYSYGTVEWEAAVAGETEKFGRYNEIAGVDTTAAILTTQYGNFKFALKEVKTVVDEVETTVTMFYVYDGTLSSENDGKITVVRESDKASLTIDRNDGTAAYTAPAKEEGGEPTEIEGEFKFHEDVLTILYSFNENGKDYVGAQTFRLVYNQDKTQIISFENIYGDVGILQDVDGGKNYFYLSGVLDGDKGYKGTYYEYDGSIESENERDKYIAHDGHYGRTDNSSVREYIFSYEVEVSATADENGDTPETQKVSYRFRTGFNSGIAVYQMYTVELNKVALITSLTATEAYGIFVGGGYNQLGFVDVYGNQYVGSISFYTSNQPHLANTPIYAFVVSGDPLFFFTLVKASSGTSTVAVMLDVTFSASTGMAFDCDPFEATLYVPKASEGEPDPDAEPEFEEKTITFGKMWFSGLGYVALITADNKVYTAYYVASGRSSFYLYTTKGTAESIKVITEFKLFANTSGEKPVYTAVFEDKSIHKGFVNADKSTLTFDGFSSATYVDRNGVAYNGSYTVHDNGTVEFSYIESDLSLITIYIVLDKEENTFQVLDDGDERIPVEEEGGTEQADGNA